MVFEPKLIFTSFYAFLVAVYSVLIEEIREDLRRDVFRYIQRDYIIDNKNGFAQ